MTAQPVAAASQSTVITPSRGWSALRCHDLWEYRELLYFLVWRDVKVRYKQSVLGVAWAVLQPVLTMLVFTVFFGRLARIPSEGVPYPIFSFAALLPWTFFAQGLIGSSNSLVGSAHLIRKVYFPRLIVPIAAILNGVVDFLLAFAVLVVMIGYYRVPVSARAAAIPLLLLLIFVAVLGVGLWLAALNVEYRDIRHVVPFLAQIWMFVTPVIYPARLVTERLDALALPRWLYQLNPMVGVVEGFRWALLGAGSDPWPAIATGTAVSLVLAVSGAFYFRRMERTFADVV